MSRIRIEGLLAAFPKLVGTGKQHTYVETENVRYAYQPIEGLYLLLITNKQSNILEDLDTLRLLSKLVSYFLVLYICGCHDIFLFTIIKCQIPVPRSVEKMRILITPKTSCMLRITDRNRHKTGQYHSTLLNLHTALTHESHLWELDFYVDLSTSVLCSFFFMLIIQYVALLNMLKGARILSIFG
jgi:hypothetical protein